MNNDVKKLLPIGSVVHVKGASKNMMIIGIATTNENKYYDYFAVLYPEGFIDDKHSYLFNHQDIDKIVFIGYINSEMQALRSELSDMLKKETNDK